MYERFTDDARNVLKSANDEAERFQHEHLGAEHVLLGLLQESDGAAATVLKNLGLDAPKVRREVQSALQTDAGASAAKNLSQSHQSVGVIEFAIEEARNLNHNYVGTEHLLLGLLSAHDSIAARVLTDAGLTADVVRGEVRKLIGEGFGG